MHANLSISIRVGSARSIREFRSPRRRVPGDRLDSTSRTHFPQLGNSTVRDPMEYLSAFLPFSQPPVSPFRLACSSRNIGK